MTEHIPECLDCAKRIAELEAEVRGLKTDHAEAVAEVERLRQERDEAREWMQHAQESPDPYEVLDRYFTFELPNKKGGGRESGETDTLAGLITKLRRAGSQGRKLSAAASPAARKERDG